FGLGHLVAHSLGTDWRMERYGASSPLPKFVALTLAELRPPLKGEVWCPLRRSSKVAAAALATSPDQLAHHLGGVVDHRDDARIVEPRRSDEAEDADDALLGVAIGRHPQRRARQREE